MMKTQYIYLSAFNCTECNGQLVAAFVATREGDGQREDVKRHLGLGCLSCGTQYDPLVPSRVVRRVVAFHWESADPIAARINSTPVAA